MKLRFDQNLSFKLCARLGDLFPDSTQVRLLGLEQAATRAVWNYAKAHASAPVSQDSDFADMSTLYGPPPKVLWVRCGNQPTPAIEQLLRDRAEAILAFDQDKNAACLEIL